MEIKQQRKSKVMVVSQSDKEIQTYQNILEPENYAVKGASTFHQVVENLNRENVDVVIVTIEPTLQETLASQLESFKSVRSLVGIVAAIRAEHLPPANLDSAIKKIIIDLIDGGAIGFFVLPFASPDAIKAEIDKSVDFMRKKTARCIALKDVEASEKIRDLELIINEEMRKCREDNEEIRHALKPILHQAQKLFRCIRPCVQRLVAMTLDVPLSEVEGVVSFYAGFREEPKGEHEIIVCLGTACYVKNSQSLLEALHNHFQIEEGRVTTDGKFSFESIRCLGICNEAPVVKIGEDIYGKTNPEKILKIISRYESKANQDLSDDNHSDGSADEKS